MRLLVTGATGYVGVHLCRALVASGHDVMAVARRTSNRSRLDPRVACTDVADLDAAFRTFLPDTVIHLAAFVTADHGASIAEKMVEDNICFGLRVLEAMLATSCRQFIHTGSYWEYAEDGGYLPNTLYAASKHAFADMAQWYAQAHRIAMANLVLYDVYGANDWRQKLLPALLALAHDVSAAPMALTEGTQQLDWVYVDDVVDAILKAQAALPTLQTSPATWSVATGNRITLRETVALLSRLAGRELPVVWGAKPWPVHQIMRPLCASVFPPPPQWEARVDLVHGLQQLLTNQGTIL